MEETASRDVDVEVIKVRTNDTAARTNYDRSKGKSIRVVSCRSGTIPQVARQQGHYDARPCMGHHDARLNFLLKSGQSMRPIIPQGHHGRRMGWEECHKGF